MKRYIDVHSDKNQFSYKEPYISDYRSKAAKMENNTDRGEQGTDFRMTGTFRDDAARQTTVNFMPSRQLPYNTVRLRRSKSEHLALLEEWASGAGEALDRRADLIVRNMEQHHHLMEDNPEAEELRREALRELPQGLTLKRNVRAKLSASVSLRSKKKPIPFSRRLKYRFSFAVKRFRDRLRNFIFSVELWYEAIRKVEGHFGSAVGSYFYFLRWLFVLNFMMTVFLMSFVVVPQILYDTAPQDTRNGSTGHSLTVLDIISGKGPLEDTPLFYGHYAVGSVRASAYQITYAYFFTFLLLYIFCFVVLCFRTAASYRRNFIEPAGAAAGGAGAGAGAAFAARVFCGWDFGISTARAATLNAHSLYNEFKELLSEQEKHNETSNVWTRLKEYFVNACVWACVLALLGGAQFGLWRLLMSRGAAADAGGALVVSAGVTAVLVVGPFLLNIIVKAEYYSRRGRVYVTLARALLLDASSLLLLFVFWARRADRSQCWESALGQEMYRLVIFDAAFSLVLIPIIEFIRGLIYNLGLAQAAAPEFNIASNSLSLMYNQAALWLGVLFSPPLAVIVTVKFGLLFYVKKAVAMNACQPARKVWRAAQTQTVLYMMVNLSLFVTLFALGSLFVRSSARCGPFREYARVYEVVTEGVLRLAERHTLRGLLAAVTRPGVIAFLMLFLAVWAYYARAQARAQRSMVQILRQMLLLEAKDKEFLLSAIAKVSNGEWQYNRKAAGAEGGDCSPEPDDSYTWRYLHGERVRTPANAAYQLDARGAHPQARRRRPDDGDSDSSFSWRGSGERVPDLDRDRWL